MEQQFQNYLNKPSSDVDLEFETKLIRTVYNFRWLYDNNHPDFSNVYKNRISWTKVSQACKKPFVECTKKWNSLLQTYFSSPSPNWVHLEKLKSFEPYLSSNIRILNVEAEKLYDYQKRQLLKELKKNRDKLFASNTSSAEKQKIWLLISSMCNAFPSGVKLTPLKWQKYWYEMKQEFGSRHIMLRQKLQDRGTTLDVTKYTDDDVQILEICGTSVNDPPEDVFKALGSNKEFGSLKKDIIGTCLKCQSKLDEILINGYCEACRKSPLCDICQGIGVGSCNNIKMSNWSRKAKDLLPTHLQNASEILTCNPCWNILKKKATTEWKSCRICDTQHANMQYLFDPALSSLRQGFQSATHVAFSEYDGLPGYICKVCKIQIQQLTNFYTKFWRTQSKLKGKHSVHFIGLANTGQTVIRDGKVYYSVNVKNEQNSTPKQGQLSSDSPPQSVELSTPLETFKIDPTIMPTTAAAAGTAGSPSPVSTASRLPFKRITLQKQPLTATVAAEAPASTTYSSDSEISSTTTTQASKPASATVGRRKTVYYDPPLAIKEIFSLQPNASIKKPSNSNGKPSISVIPAAALKETPVQTQPVVGTKLSEVMSNKSLTVTRKTFESPLPNVAAQPSINNNGGTPNQLPASNNNLAAIHKNSGRVTVTKRAGVTPKLVQTNFIPVQKQQSPLPAAQQPVVAATQPIKATSSKPAIFNVPDFETIDDAPPVFCIPKNNSSADSSASTQSANETSLAEQELIDFNPNLPEVKKEIVDESEQQIPENRIQPAVAPPPPPPPTQPSMTQGPVTPKIDPLRDPKAGMKTIRLNGNVVTVKPHPFIPDAFIPVDKDGKPKEGFPSYIRKVSSAKKLSGPAVPMPIQIPPAPIAVPKKIAPVVPLASTPEKMQSSLIQQQRQQQSLQLNQQQLQQAKEQNQQQSLLLNQQQPQQQQVKQQNQQLLQLLQNPQQPMQQSQQLQQLQQQQSVQNQQQQQSLQQNQTKPQQQQQQSSQIQQQYQNTKRPRKYWGTVDEFQVAPRSPPPPILPMPEPLILEKPKTPSHYSPIHPNPQTKTPSRPLSVASSNANDPLQTENPHPTVHIKQEEDDNDIEIVSVTPAAKEIDAPQANLFHADAFELLNLTFGEDVSQIFNNILDSPNNFKNYLYAKTEAEKERPMPNVATENSENPQPAPGAEPHLKKRRTDEATSNTEEQAAVATVGVTHEEPTQPEQEQLQLKKLRIKIKRFKEQTTINKRKRRSRLEMLETFASQVKRKSLRLKS